VGGGFTMQKRPDAEHPAFRNELPDPN